jgi:hypothetical protein
VQAASAYGIYLVDTLGGRELIYRDPAMSCVSPVPIQPRPRPPELPSRLDAAQGEAMGSFYVRNVYQSTQPIPPGSIKSLRVVRVFPQTVETPPSRSIAVYEMPKQIVGTVPVAGHTSVTSPACGRGRGLSRGRGHEVNGGPIFRAIPARLGTLSRAREPDLSPGER